jgi:hypothetical protein
LILLLAYSPPPTVTAPMTDPPVIDISHVPRRPPAAPRPAFAALRGPSLALPPAAPRSTTTHLVVGATVVAPAARLPLAGAGFAPGATVLVTDTGVLLTAGTVTAAGFFTAAITVAGTPGYHTLYAQDSAGRSAVAAYTVAPGGADGPLLAMAPPWTGPGGSVVVAWAGFPANGTAYWYIDGQCSAPGCLTIPTGPGGEGSLTVAAPATPAAYVYSMRMTDIMPSQVVQVSAPDLAYGSPTRARAPSNVPGAWGAVGEGFLAHETVRLQVNGVQVGSAIANATGVALAAFAAHGVGDGTVEKLTMTGQASNRRAFAAIYFFAPQPASPGQVQGRWESTTGSTQVVIADTMGLAPITFQALLDGAQVMTGTTTGNGLAVYSYTLPLRDQPAHNLTTLPAAGLPATSRGTILPCMLTFTDVPPGHPFQAYIRWMACHGYISGYTCGGPGEPCDPTRTPYFRPGNNVTRGQLMKMVVNAARWSPATPPSHTFADVPTTHPFYSYIETGVGHGLISGYDCGGPGEPCDSQNRAYFRPGNDITRGQLAKVIALARAYSLGYPPAPTFADVPTTHPFYLYVEALARNGVISGYACGGASEPCDPQNRPYFRPANTATRAQVAKFVAVAYGGP